MNTGITYAVIKQKEFILFLACFLGIAIVYLTHLGVVPVHAMADECRRALVAMEMSISGDYLTPTINGEMYLNKPPLYSWIIASSYHLIGNYSPFALRFPVVISILINGLLIYFVVKRYTSAGVAALSALAFMTNGRTLLFDSMLGLLEHTLALLIYAGCMAIFVFGEKKKYLLLFTISYFIAALGFMIKGLPAAAHHGIALLIYFIYTKKWKILFSGYHLAGIITFLLTISLYYVPYFNVNHLKPEIIFSKIVNESSKRYYFYSFSDFVHVLFDYPMDFIYHFLPWTLFVLLLIRKKMFTIIKENKFVFYNALLFAANSPVYWFASLKNPHYLYFLLPFLFTVLFYIYFNEDRSTWRMKLIHAVLFAAIGIAFIASAYSPFIEKLSAIPDLYIKSGVLTGGLLILFLLNRAFYDFRLYFFVGMMIFVRLAFNWFVVPHRIAAEKVFEERAININGIVKQDSLYIMASYPAGYYDGITYYMEKEREEILRLNSAIETNAYYLVDDIYLHIYPTETFLHFPYVYQDNNMRYEKEMYLVKFHP
jgi:4-amino-4-deoxy-L-arabinose transferase-like glycosyltransferase